MIVLGIDPGQKGGLAVVDSHNGGTLMRAISMPLLRIGKKHTLDIQAALDWTGTHTESDYGVIERVAAMPKQGVSSSFQFGRMYGGAEAIMYEASARQEYVPARTWKKAMGLSKDKGASIDLATRLFGAAARREYWPPGPLGGEPNDGPAEAALIALWWIRKYNS